MVGALVSLLQSGFVMDMGGRDTVAFATAAAVSGLATMAASYIPVRRVLRIDPAAALRPE